MPSVKEIMAMKAAGKADVTPAPKAAPEQPARTKRGRPKKPDALSNAERQKLWRARQKEKKS